MRGWRLGSLLLIAITLSAALAHLMELPPKMQYDARLYVQLHRTLYRVFGPVAGTAEFLALVTTTLLAVRVRKRRPSAFALSAASAGCLIALHAAFWIWVNPANQTMGNWPLDAIPQDWTRWRDQWEYTHAARAVLAFVALTTLALSIVRETDE